MTEFQGWLLLTMLAMLAVIASAVIPYSGVSAFFIGASIGWMLLACVDLILDR